MNNYFNIALLPEDKDLAKICVQLAQANCKTQSDKYLLGENAWPHVTLCQFTAEQNQLEKIWLSMAQLCAAPLMLQFDHINIRPGGDMHIGKNWVELSVIKTNSLLTLQNTVYNHLFESGIESSPHKDFYSPHLTWARCHGNKPITISLMPSEELWQKQHAFYLTIGLSDVNGVYLNCLFSNQ